MAELEANGHEPIGLSRLQDCPDPAANEVLADLCDTASLARAILETKPDGCIHLAGIAFVPVGWTQPRLVFDVNVGGSLNLLEMLRMHAPACRLVLVSSALVYGAARPDEPRDETAQLDPESLYAISKVAADLNALLYARHHGLAIMTARPCNHIGPGQSYEFMAASFAKQLADIAAGRHAPCMRVGNLDSVREFMDVRDVARAYRLLLERGRAAEAYNISAGMSVSVRRVLSELCRIAGVQPELAMDPTRFRPTDRQPMLRADKLRHDTGWAPRFTLEQTLADVYAWVRSQPA